MPDRESKTRNDAVPWSEFDADGYWKINYAAVFPEDAQIIRFASNFLVQACGDRPPIEAAVDVGAGTNLYPALLMLPWTRRLVLTDYAATNIDWLTGNLADAPGEWAWRPFWDLMADRPGYREVEDPRHQLATGHEISQLSVFDLPARTWDLGSMFFVADGITSDLAEFERAVRKFLGALNDGAPFLMAFMESSSGYEVSGVMFPAVRVTLDSLKGLLLSLPVTGTNVLQTDSSVRRLRPGYDAMLLVTGYVAHVGHRGSDRLE